MRAICVLMAACLALVAGCGKKPEEIDFGVVENSVYRNDYLGFRMKLPPAWSVQDREAQKRIAEAGGKLLTGDDKNLKAMLKASELQTVQLFAAFKHPVGAPVRFNPSVICIAERVSHLPGIKSGQDYHFHTRRVLEAGQVKVSFPREVAAETLGGRSFDVMHVDMSVANVAVRQKYYASIIRDYALVCVVSFIGPEDEAALNAILGTMTF
jgi:hypothetical protein